MIQIVLDRVGQVCLRQIVEIAQGDRPVKYIERGTACPLCNRTGSKVIKTEGTTRHHCCTYCGLRYRSGERGEKIGLEKIISEPRISGKKARSR